MPLVNMAYAPYFEVLPRKYRFRLLNACMSRFCKLALGWNGVGVPIKVIANDGNFLVKPGHRDTSWTSRALRSGSTSSSTSRSSGVGDKLYLVNTLTMRDDGRGPREALSIGQALAGRSHRSGRRQDAWNSASWVRCESVDDARQDADGQQQLRRQGQEPGAGNADRADSDRRAGADAGGGVRPVGPGRLARPATGNARPTARRCRRIPVDGQDQWRGCAFLQRQPHLDADSEARRGRALDLHQRRRRLGPPDPPPFRGRHHHEPRRCTDARRPRTSRARTSGGCARRAGCSSRSSSASSAGPT